MDDGTERGHPLRRAGRALLQVAGVFLILEPIWMLLPFAGFLYGSVLHLSTLARHPETAWLTHFVFPVLTLGWTGPILVLLGLLLFLAGAVPIYVSKIRRSGLVTGGLYRWVRHPQYVALALLSLGVLFAWGRAIAYVALFAMMLLYYHLARAEERRCRRLFGEAYDRYAERTSFVFPGDRHLRPLASRLPTMSAPIRILVSVLLTAALCAGSMSLIDTVKRARRTVPHLVATIAFGPEVAEAEGPPLESGESAGVPWVASGRLVVVRGPYRNATVPGFAESLLPRLRRSAALSRFLSFLDEPVGDIAVAFAMPHTAPKTPGRPADAGARRGPPPDPAGPDRIRLMIFRGTLAAGADLGDLFRDPASRTLRGACLAAVDLDRPTEADVVEGDVFRPGPGFPAEERWRFLVAQLAARPAGGARPPGAVAERHATATLVLVKAPILRTRLDPAFAEEILERLVGSARLRKRLARTGAGGPVVAVAFPRPGPDWYRTHRGHPRVSVFVVLVEPGEAGRERMFREGTRRLVGALVAELDLATPPGEDAVGEIAIVGPARDIEERWAFFLSGL